MVGECCSMAMPTGVEWEPHTKAALDQAIAAYSSNHLTAYFTFCEIHDRETNGPTAIRITRVGRLRFAEAFDGNRR